MLYRNWTVANQIKRVCFRNVKIIALLAAGRKRIIFVIIHTYDGIVNNNL